MVAGENRGSNSRDKSPLGLTIMYPLRNHLQDGHIRNCGAPIIPIVFEHLSAILAFGSFEGGKVSSGSSRNDGDDGASVKGEDGCVDVDGVGIKDLGEVEGRDEWSR